jgi:hypothetical protein
MMGSRLEELKSLAQDMIYSNRQEIDDVILTLVNERFESQCK